MTSASAIPVRRRDIGLDIFNGVLALFSNRNPMAYETAFHRVWQANRDLNSEAYQVMDSAQKLHLLLNRVEKNSGLDPVEAMMRSSSDIAALTNRFAPEFSGETAARQWDLLWRAAEMMDGTGVPERLLNYAIDTSRVTASRKVPPRADAVSAADWKTANSRAADVFALLEKQATSPVDRGPILEKARAPQVRAVFRSAINRMVENEGLSRRQAFDRLKADEPIFWTLAMLSFDPAAL